MNIPVGARWVGHIKPEDMTLDQFFSSGTISPEPTSGCWLWTLGRMRHGYGRFSVGRKGMLAHRRLYEMCVEPVPEGYELDHLCRVPACVNPSHLEPVTHRENMARSPLPWVKYGPFENALKTHCPQGHAYDEGNTYRYHVNNGRACRKCRTVRVTAWRRRNPGWQKRQRERRMLGMTG